MKAVSRTFKLQSIKQSQSLLGYQQQFYMQQDFEQIQGMFNGFGFMDQATFGDFEGKSNAQFLFTHAQAPKTKEKRMCKINKPVINVAATAANIKSYRIRAGYSVREIQSIFNFTSPEAVYAWERAKNLPTIDNLIVLAALYGISVEDIVATDYVEFDCDISEVKSA